MTWFIFSGGLLVGLMLHPFARMLKSAGIHYVLDLIGQIFTDTVQRIVAIQKRSDLAKAVGGGDTVGGRVDRANSKSAIRLDPSAVSLLSLAISESIGRSGCQRLPSTP